jgi:hypothetical protein
MVECSADGADEDSLRVTGVAVSPDGRYALSGCPDGIMRLWRLPDPPPAKDNP